MNAISDVLFSIEGALGGMALTALCGLVDAAVRVVAECRRR